MISSNNGIGRTAGAILLAGTILGGLATPAMAQDASQPTPAPAPTPAPQQPAIAPAAPAQTIRSIAVRGNQRLEAETVRAYANLAPGQTYTSESLDQALKDLYATELFRDVVITGAETGDLVINVQENPVINRIVLEGNKRLKSDKITPEIKLAPRQIFTRSKVRADVDRIVELYRRQGRFAARVEPKIVQLDQNRVDLVFEISEGDKSKVRRINILGNEQYSDDRLRKEMYTKQAGGILGFIKSNDSYDPDRLAADQQKLRAFYLTEGYADFRVVSALAELTPDRRDFVITYVVEEGPRYKFGTVNAESALRDISADVLRAKLTMKPGDWFNAKLVEDTVTELNELAGTYGYAFADVSPNYNRDSTKHEMNISFRLGETPRVYVERIDVTGNTVTHDKVIRREFRLNEGDAFNAIMVKRSQDRLQSLGFFQDQLEVKQAEGSSPDKVVLSVDVQEKSTGELSLSGGYSSLERFVLQLAVTQRNFMGEGQALTAAINYSQYAKSIQLGFAEPYFLDKQILLGGEIYRRDYNSFNFTGRERNSTYSQTSTGGGFRLGFPLTEYISLLTRYSLVLDNIELDEGTFFTDFDGSGPRDLECDPRKAGQYLCDELGKRLTSLVGWSIIQDNTDGIRPTRGHRVALSQDFAGLGGDVQYLRSRADATKYFKVFGDWVFSAHAEGGYIQPLEKSPGIGRDAIRITDRFFGPQLRGFDIRGIGPRVVRTPYNLDGTLDENARTTADALGGRAYYMGRLELEFPTSSSLKSMGLRPSAFLDVGSVFDITSPVLLDVVGFCIPTTTTGSVIQLDEGEQCPATGYNRTAGIREEFLGNSARPRVAIGVGVNWVSPFGPFRIDIAKALMKQDGDDTKLFSFNVGTAF